MSDLPVGDELPPDALLAANAELEAGEPEPRQLAARGVHRRADGHGQRRRRLSGVELRSALEAEGLRYGDMQIFHHYGDDGNTPEPLV